MQTCVIQFAKLPLLNRVKTRMQPHLSVEQSLELHQHLVRHTFSALSQHQSWDYQLWISESESVPGFMGELTKNVSRCGVKVQQGENLGERMHHALASVLENYRYAVIVGSDCPALDATAILQLISDLGEGCDASIIPALDGGYVALAVSQLNAHLFSDIAWGTDAVLDGTCKRLQQLGWRFTLQEALPDIDRPEDLSHIRHFPWGAGF